MSLIRVILSIIFPPLAVIDKGCGSVLIVFILYPVRMDSGRNRCPDYPQQELNLTLFLNKETL